jgi:hypothetical protein
MADPKNDRHIVERILDLIEGRLQGPEAEALQLRIASEPALAEINAWHGRFQQITAPLAFAVVPTATHDALEQLLPKQHPVSDAIGKASLYVSRLLRDLSAGPAFAGARTGGRQTSRQLLFAIGDDAELMIQIEATGPGTNRRQIVAQVLAPDPVCAVQVIDASSTTAVVTDEFGQFSFELPDTTDLRLEIVGADHRSVVDLTSYL